MNLMGVFADCSGYRGIESRQQFVLRHQEHEVRYKDRFCGQLQGQNGCRKQHNPSPCGERECLYEWAIYTINHIIFFVLVFS